MPISLTGIGPCANGWQEAGRWYNAGGGLLDHCPIPYLRPPAGGGIEVC